jgi:hypothetical protein
MKKKRVISEHASRGGKARAAVLTPEQRKEIARLAARTRWGSENDEKALTPLDKNINSSRSRSVGDSTPLAKFAGKLQLGDTAFSVRVLDNGTHVIEQRDVVRVLSGNANSDLERYIETERLQPFINPEAVSRQTIQFRIAGNRDDGTGYEATVLLDICDAYLSAREAGALATNQQDIAKRAEMITRACAKVGIATLIDEVTGYGPFKRKQECQLRLQAFIADDAHEWARMFPDEFWFELARLEGVHYSPRHRHLRWGRYVTAFVYDSVEEDVGHKLREIEPDSRFKRNHHQWLNEIGRRRVNGRLQRVIAAMKRCEDMEDFNKQFAQVLQKSPIQTELNSKRSYMGTWRSYPSSPPPTLKPKRYEYQ